MHTAKKIIDERFFDLHPLTQLVYHNLRYHALKEGWYHGFDLKEFCALHFSNYRGKNVTTIRREVLMALDILIDKGYLWIDGTTLFLRRMIQYNTVASNINHVQGIRNKQGIFNGLLLKYIQWEIPLLERRLGLIDNLPERKANYFNRRIYPSESSSI